MNNVLITGVSGFLGSSLATRLESEGKYIIGDFRKVNDANDRYRLLEAIRQYNVDTIFHFAGKSTVASCHKEPYSAILSNVIGTADVLEAASLSSSVKRVIVMGSDLEYADGNADEKAPLAFHNGIYGATKLAASLITAAYREEFGLSTTVVRSVNIYGPQDHKLDRIVPKAVYSFIHGEPFTVYTPTAKRGYVYIDDLLDALEIIEKHEELAVINVCSDFMLDAETLANKIADIMRIRYNIEPKLTFEISPYPRTRTQTLICDRLKSLGWVQKVDIDDGLELTVPMLAEYFHQNR